MQFASCRDCDTAIIIVRGKNRSHAPRPKRSREPIHHRSSLYTQSVILLVSGRTATWTLSPRARWDLARCLRAKFLRKNHWRTLQGCETSDFVTSLVGHQGETSSTPGPAARPSYSGRTWNILGAPTRCIRQLPSVDCRPGAKTSRAITRMICIDVLFSSRRGCREPREIAAMQLACRKLSRRTTAYPSIATR
jgi:hypothetical protein